MHELLPKRVLAMLFEHEELRHVPIPVPYEGDALPALHLEGVVLVISPLCSLIHDQTTALNARVGARVALNLSGMGADEILSQEIPENPRPPNLLHVRGALGISPVRGFPTIKVHRSGRRNDSCVERFAAATSLQAKKAAQCRIRQIVPC